MSECWIIEKKTQDKQYLGKENILPKHRKDNLKKKVQNIYQLKISLGYFQTSISMLKTKFNSSLF